MTFSPASGPVTPRRADARVREVAARLHAARLNRPRLNRLEFPLGDATARGFIPERWVTSYSGDIGNTFGPKGLSIGSRRHVSSSK
jgi:hypothetical protein